MSQSTGQNGTRSSDRGVSCRQLNAFGHHPSAVRWTHHHDRGSLQDKHPGSSGTVWPPAVGYHGPGRRDAGPGRWGWFRWPREHGRSPAKTPSCTSGSGGTFARNDRLPKRELTQRRVGVKPATASQGLRKQKTHRPHLGCSSCPNRPSRRECLRARSVRPDGRVSPVQGQRPWV